MSDSMNTAIDVPFQTEVSIENKTTEQLTAEANTLYHQAERLAGMSAMMFAETGRRLLEVKNRIPHGEFGKWCEENLEFSLSGVLADRTEFVFACDHVGSIRQISL